MPTLIGNRIKQARLFHGMLQSELANLTGLRPDHISHYETGTRNPSVNNLIKLSKALHVKTDWLLGLERAENFVLNVDKISAKDRLMLITMLKLMERANANHNSGQ